jgi:hypothetical protein
MSRSAKLVSASTMWDGLKVLEEQVRENAPFVPDFTARREERMILEFRRLLREAEVEYVSSGAAADLTGWDAGTLRRYARKALAGEAMPEEWSLLVVRRDGKEYSYVLSSIPAKARNAA